MMNMFAIALLSMMFCAGAGAFFFCADGIAFTQVVVPLIAFGVCAIFARVITCKRGVEEMEKDV